MKICPLCDAEYWPEADRCTDCHTPLIPRGEYDRSREPLPFSEDLVEIRTETMSWIKRLSEALARAGIRCHVRYVGALSDGRLGLGTSDYYHTLYVRPEHEGASRHLDRTLFGRAAEEEIEEEWGRCPACETPRPAGAEECPECGLFFGVTAS